MKQIKLVILSLAVIATMSVMSSCTRIDAGNVGLKVSMAGGDKGVSNIKYTTGWNFYMPWATKIVEIPVFVQHKQYDEFEVWAKGGTIFKVHPIVNYQVNASKADSMYQVFRKDLIDIEDGWMKGIVQQTYRDAINTFEPDSLLNNRAIVEAELSKELSKKLHPYFLVSNTTSNLEPDQTLKANIAAKANAVQAALRIENEQKAIKAQAENDILSAKRDSSVQVIAALAEAKSIQVKQDALKQSPQYIDLIKAEKWNGQLPQIVTGGTGGLFLQVPGTK